MCLDLLRIAVLLTDLLTPSATSLRIMPKMVAGLAVQLSQACHPFNL